MGNYSRDPGVALGEALDRDYVRVRFQQGKPALDRELNLAADLAAPARLAGYLGAGIAGAGTDFAISGLDVAQNDFAIAPGRCLVNGLEAVLRAPVTYRTQPNLSGVGALPAGASNVYLRVREREVTSAEDPLLANPGDVAFETAVRTKVDWDVVVSQVAVKQPTHFLLAVINTAPPSVEDRRLLGHNLALTAGELHEARGTAATLAGRLGVAHAPGGALAQNVVGTAQLLALAVTQPKVAAGAIGLPQLKRSVRFSGSISLAAGADSDVVALTGPAGTGNRPAVLLTTVTATSAGTVTWREFARQTLSGTAVVFSRGVRIHNEGTAAVTVDVEVSELVST